RRCVLTGRLTEPGKKIIFERISAGLWGQHKARSTRKTVQSYVARLRAAMTAAQPHGASAIATKSAGYLLDVPPETIDAVRFERLLALAREEWRAEAFRLAREKLSAALALWRGEPFADCVDLPAVEASSVRLAELHADAVELRVDVDLALGAGPELVAELTELVARHPHRERYWSQLILAPYRSARQSD